MQVVLVEPQAGVVELAFQAAQVVHQLAPLLFAAAVLLVRFVGGRFLLGRLVVADVAVQAVEALAAVV